MFLLDSFAFHEIQADEVQAGRVPGIQVSWLSTAGGWLGRYGIDLNCITSAVRNEVQLTKYASGSDSPFFLIRPSSNTRSIPVLNG